MTSTSASTALLVSTLRAQATLSKFCACSVVPVRTVQATEALPRAAALTVQPGAMWFHLVVRLSATAIFVLSAYISHRQVRLAALHVVRGHISTPLAMMPLPTVSTVWLVPTPARRATSHLRTALRVELADTHLTQGVLPLQAASVVRSESIRRKLDQRRALRVQLGSSAHRRQVYFRHVTSVRLGNIRMRLHRMLALSAPGVSFLARQELKRASSVHSGCFAANQVVQAATCVHLGSIRLLGLGPARRVQLVKRTTMKTPPLCVLRAPVANTRPQEHTRMWRLVLPAALTVWLDTLTWMGLRPTAQHVLLARTQV